MGFFSEIFGLHSSNTSSSMVFREHDFLLNGSEMSSLDNMAKKMYDGYFSGDKKSFDIWSNRIIHDIVDDPLFRETKQPYLLGRSLFLWMINHKVDLEKTIYGVIVKAMHSCLLISRRNTEKGIEPNSKGKLVASAKMLCVLYDRYQDYIIEVLHKGLPNASADVVVHQFFALEIVSYMQVYDNRNIIVTLDDTTDMLYNDFVTNNRHIINSIPDNNMRVKLLNHVHDNEDAIIGSYSFLRQ